MESREGGGARVGSLDTLRGVAITMVMLFHATVRFPVALLRGPLQSLVENEGVQLFFLVSAYTMCTMWEVRAGEAHRTLNFYIRRLCRIAPLYWAAILLYGPILGFRPIGDTLANVLLVHGAVPSAINSVVPGGWSIGVEVAFYLFFPAMTLIPPALLIAVGFAWYLAFGLAAEHLFPMAADPIRLYYSPLTQFPIFAIGMYVHAVLKKRDVRLVPNLLLLGSWLGIAAAAKHLGLDGRPFFWAILFLLALLMAAVVRYRIALPPLSFLGRISYSAYLLHVAVLLGCERLLLPVMPPAATLLVFLGAAVAVAYASFRTAEKASQQLARALVLRGRGGARATATAS